MLGVIPLKIHNNENSFDLFYFNKRYFKQQQIIRLSLFISNSYILYYHTKYSDRWNVMELKTFTSETWFANQLGSYFWI